MTVHVPMPEQPSPFHPSNVEPRIGTAVSVTELPGEKSAAQILPQSIPAGVLVTLPEPLPGDVTVKGNDVGVDASARANMSIAPLESGVDRGGSWRTS